MAMLSANSVERSPFRLLTVRLRKSAWIASERATSLSAGCVLEENEIRLEILD